MKTILQIHCSAHKSEGSFISHMHFWVTYAEIMKPLIISNLLRYLRSNRSAGRLEKKENMQDTHLASEVITVQYCLENEN